MDYKVQLFLGDNYKIKIKSNHNDYLVDMKEEFAIHVPNYFFMGKYKAGMWDGCTHYISERGFLPYGLLLDFMRTSLKLFPNVKIVPDDGVKALFKGPQLPIKYDLSLQPRPYQKEAIEICLERTKGIIQSATASGKSLVISYIIKHLLSNREVTGVKKCLIIVPSIGLTGQFKEDMISYGLPENLIGEVHSKSKEWDKHIVISTWQSLKSNHDKLELFECIIVDEVHKAKAFELKKILSKSRSHYRFGFTGTLNVHITDLYNTRAFLGPVLKKFSSGFLADKGFISKCNVEVIKLSYPSGTIANDYRGIKTEVFNNSRRFDIISKIVNEADSSILLLVNYINEGDRLLKLINRKTNKEPIFLSGKDDVDMREKVRQRIIKGEKLALIATYGIMSTGVNIPNLKYLIIASPIKSKITTLQSIGRILRLHESKVDGATVYDIIDDVKYIKKHGNIRLEYYESEGFDIKNYNGLPFC